MSRNAVRVGVATPHHPQRNRFQFQIAYCSAVCLLPIQRYCHLRLLGLGLHWRRRAASSQSWQYFPPEDASCSRVPTSASSSGLPLPSASSASIAGRSCTAQRGFLDRLARRQLILLDGKLDSCRTLRQLACSISRRCLALP